VTVVTVVTKHADSFVLNDLHIQFPFPDSTFTSSRRHGRHGLPHTLDTKTLPNIPVGLNSNTPMIRTNATVSFNSVPIK